MLENEFHFVIEVVSQVSLTRVSEFIAIVVDRAGESIVEFGNIHPLPVKQRANSDDCPTVASLSLMQQPTPHTFIKVVRDASYIELSKSRLPREEVSETLRTVCAGVSRFSPRARAGSFPVTLGSSRLHLFR